MDNKETGGEVMGRESSELHRMESHIKELQAENAKLQAERDVLHGALMKAGGLADIDRWPERYPLVYGCMTDAIKDTEHE
jgi:hypothetical protein